MGKADSGRAGVAEAVEHDLMILQLEAFGSGGSELRDASLHLEHAIAAPTVEVMMMTLARQLVSWRLAGKLHRGDGPLVVERLQVPVHRRDTEPRDVLPRGFEKLAGAQGVPHLLERSPDRATLAGVSMHRGP